MYTIVVWIVRGKAHDIPVLHPFGHDQKKSGRECDTNKRQDVLMLKPFPSDNLLNQELRTREMRLFWSQGDLNYTPFALARGFRYWRF